MTLKNVEAKSSSNLKLDPDVYKMLIKYKRINDIISTPTNDVINTILKDFLTEQLPKHSGNTATITLDNFDIGVLNCHHN